MPPQDETERERQLRKIAQAITEIRIAVERYEVIWEEADWRKLEQQAWNDYLQAREEEVNRQLGIDPDTSA